MLKVLFATSEARPYAKTGGLGEVAGALPPALQALGCELRLVLPGYRSALQRAEGLRVLPAALPAPGGAPMRVLEGRLPGSGVPVWFLDCPALFDRPGGLYLVADGREWPDNAWRFGRFCQALSALARPADSAAWRPDVVHCHDWQTGLLPALLAGVPGRPASVFTIHNLAYQGVYDRPEFEALGLPEALWHPEALEYHGRFSFLKGGLACADVLTTVSPGYAAEIQAPEWGMGLDGLLRHRGADLVGILNGVDYADWDPAHDPALPAAFHAGALAGKAVNKAALQRELGLEVRGDALLLGTVSRLTWQKGIDLVLDALQAEGALTARWPAVQWVVLGEGEAGLQQRLQALAAAAPGRFALQVGYDEALAHRIVAGSDALLVPSRFEPCGLTQLHGMRYGTLPIVRLTGGLADTVTGATAENLPAGEATGFVFGEASAAAVAGTLDWVQHVYGLPEAWRAMQRAAMGRDFGWGRSARAYLAAYRRALSALARPAA